MPISSGALEWPVSYYRKPEDDNKSRTSSEWTPVSTPRGPSSKDYTWQPQLTDRQNYEKWRRMMDRKDPLRVKKPKRGLCFGCLGPSKVDVFKEGKRGNPQDVIKRSRRKRCCLVGCCTSVFLIAVTAACIFTFLHFTDQEELGPAMLVECGGKWGIHYTIYKEVLNNGTTTYRCCYFFDVLTNDNATYWKTRYQDSFVSDADKDNCRSPGGRPCEDYESDFKGKGIPWSPCSAPVGCKAEMIVLMACASVMYFVL